MVRTGLLAHAPLRRGSHRRERTCLRRMWDCVLQSRVLAREGRHSRAAIVGAVDHLSRYGKLSPGTAKTMFEGLPEGGRIRQDGRIVKVPSTYKVETTPLPKVCRPPRSPFPGATSPPRTTPPGFPTSKSS